MYESLINKNVKIVWDDNGNNKAISGILIEVDDNCLCLRAGLSQRFIIHKKSIVSCKELVRDFR